MTPEGKCKVKCRIKQEDTDENFSMIVPIKIDFGDYRFYPMRLNIKGKMTEIELPLLPMKPKNIQFNALESVLCEYDTDDYENIK